MRVRGGFIHNEILLRPVECCLRMLGANVFQEHHVAPGRSSGYVDLLATWPWLKVCVEAEMSSRRVWRDIEKSLLLKADILVIVTPDCAVRDSCRNSLGGIPSISTIHELNIWILPLAPAIQRLNQFINSFSAAECPSVSEYTNTKERS